MIRDEILTAVKKASGETQIQLEIPENEDFGDYSSNIAMAIFSKFQIPNSKFQKNSKLKISKYKTPRDIAEDIVKQLKTEKNITGIVDKIEVAGPGFINFFLSNKALLLELQKVIKEANQYGSANIGKGKNILVEYSSPNIAKYFGIGHLRSTIIGQALYNLYKFLGYKTIGDNHIGDWGTQFGAILAQIQSSKFPGLAEAKPRAGKVQNDELEILRNKTIKKVTEDIEDLKFHTAIASMMEYLNALENKGSTKNDAETLVHLLSPFAPHFAEEIWREIWKNKQSVFKEPWPKYDPKKIQDENISIVVQFNGKTRGMINSARGISQDEIENIISQDEKLKKYLIGSPKKVIFVKDKLINFVI